MAQITYTDKVALNENPEIAAINKVSDDDMNEIKSVVNANYNNTIQITNSQPSDNDWKIWVDNSQNADNTYYNNNGTATQFKATTYDTLPVGTEVDYDGNTAPTGWTEIDELIQKEELTLTYSTSGSNIIIDYSIDDLDNGIILINGHLEGENDVFLTALINYGTKYAVNIIDIRGTNINNSQASLTNNNKALLVPATGTIPTGIGTVKAVLIKLS